MTSLLCEPAARQIVIQEIMTLTGMSAPDPKQFRAKLEEMSLDELSFHRNLLLEALDELLTPNGSNNHS